MSTCQAGIDMHRDRHDIAITPGVKPEGALYKPINGKSAGTFTMHDNPADYGALARQDRSRRAS